MCTCDELKQFLYIALDYHGNIVVISDYAKYPNAYVDPKDNQITLMHQMLKTLLNQKQN